MQANKKRDLQRCTLGTWIRIGSLSGYSPHPEIRGVRSRSQVRSFLGFVNTKKLPLPGVPETLLTGHHEARSRPITRSPSSENARTLANLIATQNTAVRLYTSNFFRVALLLLLQRKATYHALAFFVGT
jgi:hypothetical protein